LRRSEVERRDETTRRLKLTLLACSRLRSQTPSLLSSLLSSSLGELDFSTTRASRMRGKRVADFESFRLFVFFFQGSYRSSNHRIPGPPRARLCFEYGRWVQERNCSFISFLLALDLFSSFAFSSLTFSFFCLLLVTGWIHRHRCEFYVVHLMRTGRDLLFKLEKLTRRSVLLSLLLLLGRRHPSCFARAHFPFRHQAGSFCYRRDWSTFCSLSLLLPFFPFSRADFFSFLRQGNDSTHIILRGSNKGPNYSAEHVEEVAAKLAKAGLVQKLMVSSFSVRSTRRLSLVFRADRVLTLRSLRLTARMETLARSTRTRSSLLRIS